MTLNLAAAGVEWDAGERSWDGRDALLYALGVGAGARDATHELDLTTENSLGVDQRVLPTFATVIAPLGGGPSLGDFDSARVLHGEEVITVHRLIPVSGTVRVRGRVDGFADKGADALIVLSFEGVDARDGESLISVTMTLFARGEGGFGGAPAVAPTTAWVTPDGPPDLVLSEPTAPNQALIYRLSGDRNPLHSDPRMASAAGYDRPILHGLCTYGITGRALLHAVCGSDPSRFRTMAARFSSPVLPGDMLDVHVWSRPDGCLFRTCVGERVVLDRGVLTTSGAGSS